ncbi:UNVERIFIED_CONTAM: hypothetical protein K2H54_021518 [Gekko kuhli]
MTTAPTYSFTYKQIWEEPKTHVKKWKKRTRMKVSDELQPYSSFHRERKELEELGEKDASELELFPGGLEREESALDTTDQETIMLEEEGRKSSCVSPAEKKKKKRRRLEISIERT